MGLYRFRPYGRSLSLLQIKFRLASNINEKGFTFYNMSVDNFTIELNSIEGVRVLVCVKYMCCKKKRRIYLRIIIWFLCNKWWLIINKYLPSMQWSSFNQIKEVYFSKSDVPLNTEALQCHISDLKQWIFMCFFIIISAGLRKGWEETGGRSKG